MDENPILLQYTKFNPNLNVKSDSHDLNFDMINDSIKEIKNKKSLSDNILDIKSIQESINLGLNLASTSNIQHPNMDNLQSNIEFGSLMNQGEIYCITNRFTQEKYIGKTKCLKKINNKYVYKGYEHRFQQHMQRAFSENEKMKNDCKKFYTAIRYFGKDAFIVEMIERCDLSIINQRERFYIQHFKTRRKGYNAAAGGVPRRFLKKKGKQRT